MPATGNKPVWERATPATTVPPAYGVRSEKRSPPFTPRDCPCIHAPSSDVKETTIEAMFEGSPGKAWRLPFSIRSLTK